MSIGLVFSIEEFSVFDGPGIRTTVFLKGCPLSCSWCHNPEGQSFTKEILRSPNGCIECGECTKKALAVNGGTRLVEECIEVCPRNLLRVSGTEYTSDQLVDRVMKNTAFYGEDGGVTFSGGEPLAQPDYLYECLVKLKGRVHRAVQTSGWCDGDTFRKISSEAELFLFDLKVIDREDAIRFTGVDNTPILDNLAYLADSGKSFIIRLPLIPEVTDTAKNISNLTALLKGYGIGYAEALPYNTFAGSKYKLCGRRYTPAFDIKKEVYIPTKEFSENGIELKVL